MSKQATASASSGSIGLMGLVVLFWNFDDAKLDLYDAITMQL